MKRIAGFVFLLLTIFGVCACGENTQKNDGQATAETVTETPSVLSGTAVSASPIPIDPDDAYGQAEEMVKNMTLEQKIGQMFLVDLYQLDQRRTLDGTITEVTRTMGEAIRRYNIGGVFLTEENIKNKEQGQQLIRDLQAEAVTGGSLYAAVEEDGGGDNSISSRVAGLNDTGYITPGEMAVDMSAKQVYQAGKNIGSELTDMGVNLNLSPVADIGNKNNPEYSRRCLGTEVEQVCSLLESYVKGMREGGLAVTLKYFPGIGNVPGNYKEEVLENKDSLMSIRNNNLLTYQSGIAAGADCVMVGSVSASEVTVKKIPAFMSKDIITKLLREELNFEGVVMSSPFDDNVIRNNYTYEFAVVEAVKAGCDMIVLPGELEKCYQALLSAVKEGKIDEKMIDSSVCRILQNKIQRGILMLDKK